MFLKSRYLRSWRGSSKRNRHNIEQFNAFASNSKYYHIEGRKRNIDKKKVKKKKLTHLNFRRNIV